MLFSFEDVPHLCGMLTFITVIGCLVSLSSMFIVTLFNFSDLRQILHSASQKKNLEWRIA